MKYILAVVALLSVSFNAQSQNLFPSSGKVGIGTSSPGTSRLAVEGTIAARRVKVTSANPWPDYVFHADYHLPALSALEAFIIENKHLPDLPTATQVKDGVDLGEVNRLLVQKVEESMI